MNMVMYLLCSSLRVTDQVSHSHQTEMVNFSLCLIKHLIMKKYREFQY